MFLFVYCESGCPSVVESLVVNGEMYGVIYGATCLIKSGMINGTDNLFSFVCSDLPGCDINRKGMCNSNDFCDLKWSLMKHQH